MAAIRLTSRLFFVDAADQVHRVFSSRYFPMLSDPRAHPLPQFAGQRVRAAELTVRLERRKPVEVVREAFFICSFGEAGALRVDEQMRQAAAALEAYSGLAIQESTADPKLVDASSRFQARGGRWSPKDRLRQALRAAALGTAKCKAL